MQGIEVGDAIDAEDDGLAVDHELLLPDLARGLGDPRVALGPVIAAARDQAYAIGVALQADAIAVVLDLVEPVSAGRDLGPGRGDAELDLSRKIKISISDRYCTS
jgi:hypothetical protein